MAMLSAGYSFTSDGERELLMLLENIRSQIFSARDWSAAYERHDQNFPIRTAPTDYESPAKL